MRSPFYSRRLRRGPAVRLRRLLIPLLLAVCSVLGMLAQAPPAAAKAVPPPVKNEKPVPVHKVQGKGVHIPTVKPARVPKVSWPSVSSATVTPGPSAVRAGSAPVWVSEVSASAGKRSASGKKGVATPSAPASPSSSAKAKSPASPAASASPSSSAKPSSSPAPSSSASAKSASLQSVSSPAAGKVKVAVASRKAATAAGVRGMVFTVGHAAGNAASAGTTHVKVDYSSFKDAYGGDYASRLRLVELPACALTTPQKAACRRATPLATTDNVRNSTLSADVPLPAGTSAATVGTAPSPSGSGGNYTATKLTEAGSWAEAGNSGAFTYSYPVSTPAVPGGLSPKVELDYNSQTVDGETSSTNNQASEIGDGFDYEPGSISRSYIPCSNPDSGAPANSTTGVPDQADLCYSAEDDVTTLNLNGSSVKLVQDKNGGGWHAQSDGNEKIEYLTGKSNSTGDGGAWKVTEPDGTEYFFGEDQLPGYASGDASSNSSWNVPVYDYGLDGPCPKSNCYEPWKWNLDYVVDPHGDEESLFYNYEQNYYAKDGGTTGSAEYVQGGALAKIEYGFNTGAGLTQAKENGYPSSYAGEVDFTTAEDRTDIPSDLACTSGGACSTTSPTFWSKYRLTGITTKAATGSGGSLAALDSWALAQCHESTSDSSTNTANQCQGTTTSPIWLQQITQTGKDGGSVSLPPVSFTGTSMPNLVVPQGTTSTFDLIPRDRMTKVINETGGETDVSYTGEDNSCHNGTFPSTDANTTMCYPDWWDNTDSSSSSGTTTTAAPAGPTESWFNKYAVSSVTAKDTTGDSPAQVTSYTYDGPAWHYTEDSTVSAKVPVPCTSATCPSPVTTQDERTWDEWRGFKTVTTETGASPDPVTKKTDTYLQGMDGDPQSGGGTSSVSVSDSQGDTVTDSGQYQGTQLEDIVYNGTTGSMVTDTVTLPWSSTTPTAQQDQPSPIPELQAFYTGAKETKTYTALAGGGNREADTASTYDDHGRVTQTATAPDTSDSSEDTWTCTTYADNADEWIMSLAKEVRVVTVPCDDSSPSYPADAISDTLAYYDGATDMSSGTSCNGTSEPADTPCAGNVTETQLATSYDGNGNPQYTTQNTSTFDEYGRVLTSADADNRTTTTTYSPASGAEPSQETVTDPQGLQTVTTYDQARQLPLTETSPAGLTTTETYDALGRLTAVWEPGDATSGPASMKFAYTVSSSAPSFTVTSTLDPDASGYLDSATVYDSLGRTVEDQEQQPGGGWDIADTSYDSNGKQTFSAGPYYAGTITEGTLVEASKDDVADETSMVYDGAGRTVKSVAEDKGTETWETDAAYGGNYTTTSYKCASSVPKCAGTPETVLTDGRGLETAVYQYHAGASPDPGDSSSDYDKTTYSYFPSQQLKTITDAAGNQWQYSYDLSGNITKQSDPDAGTSTSTYDAANQLVTSTDARGKTVSYVYDKDGRKTAEYDTTGGASETSSDELASWTYDTLAKGQLTSSSSYYDGSAYTEKTMGYNAFGEPTGTEMIIPSSEGKLAGTYITEDKAYAKTGELESYEDSANGGLPAETVNYAYNAAGDPTSVQGTQSYVNSLSYDELGDPRQYSLGTSSKPVYVTDSYDPQTGSLTGQQTDAGTTPATVDDLKYSYDNVGNVLSENDQPSGGSAQSQCFQYDYLGRLTQAWSQGSACTASSTPSTSAEGGAAAPYWNTYKYDTIGNLTKQTSEQPDGTTTTTTSTFPSPGSAQPHAPSSATQIGTTTATSDYTYDAAGNLTKSSGLSVLGSPSGSQNLTWDDADRLASDDTSSGTSDYVYDADAKLLIEKDPGQNTLFLADEQIVLNTTTGTLSGTRYYSTSSADGASAVASRSSSGEVDYLVGDQQGTASLAIRSSDLYPDQRYYDPYGNQVGTPPDPWPAGNKGFVGGTDSKATGLTNLGAREYQPQSGAFISPDSLIDPSDPQDLNGYAYASDNPATKSDPTGQRVDNGDGCNGSAQYVSLCSLNKETPKATAVPPSPPPSLGSKILGGLSSAYNAVSDFTGATALNNCAADQSGEDWGDCAGGLASAVSLLAAPAREADVGVELLGSLFDDTVSGIRGLIRSLTRDDPDHGSPPKSKAPSPKTEGGGPKTEGGGSSGGKGAPRGCSFAPSTDVLLASGNKTPISSLKPGDKVLATNTKTGKTGPETVSAVEINHDTDLYNLKVKSGGHVTVLRTTSNHLFWIPSKKQWVPAAKLKKGERLKTANGTVDVADGGAMPKKHDGWMWDLTVPGDNDHDFYVTPAQSIGKAATAVGSYRAAVMIGILGWGQARGASNVVPVLAHNCDDHVVLGVNPHSDNLAQALRDGGDSVAHTFNDGNWGNVSPINGRPEWMNGVTSAVSNPDVGLSVTLDGLPGNSPEEAFQNAYLRGVEAGPSGAVQPGYGTAWEMSVIGRNVYRNSYDSSVGRAWSSIQFYWRGVRTAVQEPDWAALRGMAG